MTRGRPPFKPTQAMRRKVAIAAGGGMTHQEIGLALGITQPTLRKHFKHELQEGAVAKRLEVLDAMHRAAKKGNVSAQRAYLSTVLAVPEDGKPVQPQKKLTVQPKKGKKEIAQEEAMGATTGSDWDDLLPPAGIVLQ